MHLITPPRATPTHEKVSFEKNFSLTQNCHFYTLSYQVIAWRESVVPIW
jgi:hypothetical protein